MSLSESRRCAARWTLVCPLVAIVACGGGNASETDDAPSPANGPTSASSLPTDGGGTTDSDDGNPSAFDVQRFPSALLGRDYPYTIYLPPGYDDGSDVYPVLYLLHGSFSDESEWLASGRIDEVADELIDDGMIPPVVIVMPGSESWWVDGYNEPAESALLDELIPHIESTWRVRTDRAARSVGGISAGGYGAVNLMLEHPDRFGAAMAIAPAVYRPLPPADSSANQHPTFLDVDGNFDPAQWETLNYPTYIERYASSDVTVPLFIGAGDDDVFDIAYHAAELFRSMRALQPEAVEFRVIDGGHDWDTFNAMVPEALSYVLTRQDALDEE